MTPCRTLLLGWVWLAMLTGVVHANDSADDVEARDRTERQRIDEGRSAVEKRFAAEQAQCYLRFAVTDCLSEAKKKRRQELGVFRREEIALNDARRARQEAQRRTRLEDRVATDRERTAAERAARTEASVQRHQQQLQSRTRVPAASDAAPSAPTGGASVRSPAAAAEAEAAYRKKLEDAARHRESRDRRIAERAKPPASALPPPPR